MVEKPKISFSLIKKKMNKSITELEKVGVGPYE
jgi:hypothetical protein